MKNYNGNVNLYVRSLLLEVQNHLIQNDHSSNVEAMLNKIKFMVLDTNMEYLLTKVFLYQANFYKQ